MMDLQTTSSRRQDLTPKQHAFVQAYIETGNGCEAYRRAYRAERMSAKAITVESTRLLRNPSITLATAAARRQSAERHEVTVDSLTEWLMDARALAMASRSPAAAVSAIMAIAKLHGLLVERTHNVHTRPNGQPIRPILNVTVGQSAALELTDAELRDIAGVGGRLLNG
jgi:phage terminase small subunit